MTAAVRDAGAAVSAVRKKLGLLHVEPDGCVTSHGLPIICKANGHLLAQMADRNVATANLIVNACNAHDDLVEVLRELLAEVEDFHKSTGHEDEGGSVQCDAICALMPKARAALAKAGAP